MCECKITKYHCSQLPKTCTFLDLDLLAALKIFKPGARG